MNDLISRQAAIDYCYQLINVEHQQGSDEMNYGQERVDQTETILHHLEFMPSAHPEPCEDAVSKKAVIDAIDEWKEACEDSGHKETVSDIKLIRKDFIELPPVTPKQRTGKWIHVSEETWKCDQCGEISCCSPNFCPDCGADMRGEKNEI